jgi:hypothetical protein
VDSTTPLVETPARIRLSVVRGLSSLARFVVLKAPTRVFVTTMSPASGASSGTMAASADPTARRPEPATAANDLFSGETAS